MEIKAGQVWVRGVAKRVILRVDPDMVFYETRFSDGRANSHIANKGVFIRRICAESKLDKKYIINQFFNGD